MKKDHVTLKESDRVELESIVSKSTGSARQYRRALALLELNEGKTFVAVAERVSANSETVRLWRNRYQKVGLDFLNDAARSGRPVEISGEQRAKITALACTTPPEGHGSWTLRMLADKVVEIGYCESISHTHVAAILKKTNSSHT